MVLCWNKIFLGRSTDGSKFFKNNFILTRNHGLTVRYIRTLDIATSVTSTVSSSTPFQEQVGIVFVPETSNSMCIFSLFAYYSFDRAPCLNFSDKIILWRNWLKCINVSPFNSFHSYVRLPAPFYYTVLSLRLKEIIHVKILSLIYETRTRKHRRAAAKPGTCANPPMLSTVGRDEGIYVGTEEG